MYTIKQLAEAAGTHKTGIRRTITALGLSDQLTKDQNGVVQIPDHVAELVLRQYQNEQEPTAPDPETVSEPVPEQQDSTTSGTQAVMVEALTAQLQAKDEQIAALTKLLEAQQQITRANQQTIDSLTAALTAAQQLHAGTITAQLQERTPAHDQTAAPIVEAEPEPAEDPKTEERTEETAARAVNDPPEPPTTAETENAHTPAPQKEKAATGLFSWLKRKAGR